MRQVGNFCGYCCCLLSPKPAEGISKLVCLGRQVTHAELPVPAGPAPSNLAADGQESTIAAAVKSELVTKVKISLKQSSKTSILQGKDV